ncbi:acetyl-CoA synthetase [Panacagrimonas perspica]|uniref:acetate--CoA ligase n=1 Tax=Panacagrimonas perspica TaxID=381431 RepID=A0A4R7P4E7_9GAMM|nr:AMP-binding protein [Panacagrimonas perspica]TDU28567.1 acetyl-CoA synthetase [Panacagrimonas perspica]THD04902.1 acetyl-coenzyme A synthetase [Panacagrimonas perspica]
MTTTQGAGDPLHQLLSRPLVPLRPHWRSTRQQNLLAEARAVQASHGKDAYWEWAAGHLRWMQPWTTTREGHFPNFRYFVGGRLNVCDNCVDRHVDDPARANKPAIIWEGEPGEVVRWTYAELRERVARFANALKSLGVRRGDVVAIYLPNLPESFVAVHACNRIGAVYTILFAGFSPEAVALRLQAARAKVLVTADACWRRGKKVPLLGNARKARPSAPALETIVVIDRCATKPELDAGEVAYETLMAAHPADCPCEPLEANEPAFLIFTSGTESKPKGVVHSAAGFLLGAWANVLWQVGPDDADLYWCAADIGWLTFPIHVVIGGLAHGTSLLCYEGAFDTPVKDRFYQIIARHQVTKILSAPTALRMLRSLGDEAARAQDLSRLKLITVQGEPLDPDTFDWTVQTFDVPVINAYGQTETGSTWTLPVYGVEPLKAGSCGTPVPGHDYEVVDDTGQPVPRGVKGNLVLKDPFPTLARTIWDDPDRYVSAYFTRFPGRYQTSDEAIVDHDGHLWVLGRADDVINVAAHRISTMEIESIVCAQPGVADGAVVGVNDALKGTVPVAFVILRAGADVAAVQAQVDAAVVDGIGAIARLSRVYVCSALPKTRAGKTMRRLLREAAETGNIRGDTTGLEDLASLGAVLKAVADA